VATAKRFVAMNPADMFANDLVSVSKRLGNIWNVCAAVRVVKLDFIRRCHLAILAGTIKAYLYCREPKQAASIAKMLTKDEARRIASNIAKRQSYWGLANPSHFSASDLAWHPRANASVPSLTPAKGAAGKPSLITLKLKAR